MNTELINDRIKTFWEWFVQNEQNIRDGLADETMTNRDSLVENINNRILDFGMFTWEIGPESGKPYYFIISPNGNKELLKLSKLIIKASPDLPDWKFYHSRPCKDWDLKFSLYDNNMMECHIDASIWKFMLFRKPGNKVHISFFAGNTNHLDYETRKIAGDHVVVNILGEECKINFVSYIDFISEIDLKMNSDIVSIQFLKQNVDKLVSQSEKA